MSLVSFELGAAGLRGASAATQEQDVAVAEDRFTDARVR